METTGATDKEKAIGDTPRQRFYVELDPDTTTIVSWKKLLKSQQQSSKKQEPATRLAPEESLKVDKKNTERHGSTIELEQRFERILSIDRHSQKQTESLSKSPEEKDDEFLHMKRGKDLLKVYSRKISTASVDQIQTAKPNDTKRQIIAGFQTKDLDVEGANRFAAARDQKDQGTRASDQPKLQSEKLTSHNVAKEYTPKGYLKKYNKSVPPDLNLPHHTTEPIVDKKARKKKISVSSSTAVTNSKAQAHYSKQRWTTEHNNSTGQHVFGHIVSSAEECSIDNLPNQSKMKRRMPSVLKEYMQHQQAPNKKGKCH